MRNQWVLAAAAVAAVLGISGCDSGGGGGGTTVAEGTATLASSHGTETVKIRATSADGKVTGTIDVSSEGGAPFTVDVHCSVEREGALMVGGDVRDGPKAGTHAAAVIRQGEPDRLVMWFEDPPPADTCGAFLAAIPPGLVAYMQPIDGDITAG